MTPIRLFRVACNDALAPGSMTPIIGSSKRRCSTGKASALAVLQATTMNFTSRRTRKRVLSIEKRVTVSGDFVPYGTRAESPK